MKQKAGYGAAWKHGYSDASLMFRGSQPGLESRAQCSVGRTPAIFSHRRASGSVERPTSLGVATPPHIML